MLAPFYFFTALSEEGGEKMITGATIILCMTALATGAKAVKNSVEMVNTINKSKDEATKRAKAEAEAQKKAKN